MNDASAFITQRLEDVHFEALLKDAMDAVTTFGGRKWTDHGEHDPGVTLIQSLSFVAADLCYRNTLPLEDLLTPAPDAQTDGLFPRSFGPQKALTCSPVTADDYRRGILDLYDIKRQPYFRNARIEREPVEERFTYFYNGLTREFLFEDASSETTQLSLLGNLNIYAEPMRHQDLAAARKELKSYLTQHRNIGEGIGRIDLMRSTDANVYIDIELSDDVSNAAKVMADIFTAANDFLSPVATRSSAAALRSSGATNDEIYNGPTLRHGWITELPPNVDYRASDVINFTPLVNGLLTIDGVRSLQSLSLSRDSQTWEWTREADTFGWVWSGDPFEVLAAGEMVRLFKKGQQLKPTASEIAANVAQPPLIVDIPTTLPYGRFRALGRYYSVTTRLPEIYGMLSLDPSLQAQHLYQFLLTFEQMFANAADQLAMLPQTLSFERDFQTRQWGAEWPYAPGSLPDRVNAAYAGKLKAYIDQAAFDADKELETVDYLLGYFGAERAPRTLQVPADEFLAVQQGILRQYAEFAYNRANVRIDQVSALQRRIAARLGFGSVLFTEESIDLSRLPFYIVEHRALLPQQPNPAYNGDQQALGAEIVSEADGDELLRILATRDPDGVQLSTGQAIDLIIRRTDPETDYVIELQMVVGVEGGAFDLDPADSRLLETNVGDIMAAAHEGRLYWRNSKVWLKDMEYPLFLDGNQNDLGPNQYRFEATPFPTNLIPGDVVRILNESEAGRSGLAADDLHGEVLSIDPLFQNFVVQCNEPLPIPSAGLYWYVDKPINDRFSLQASFVFDLNLVQNLAEPYATAAWVFEQVQAETPAHVQPLIHWLPSAAYENFGAIYDQWQNSGQPLGDLSYELLYWLAIGDFPFVRTGIGTMIVATPAQRDAVVGSTGDGWDEAALAAINPVHVPPTTGEGATVGRAVEADAIATRRKRPKPAAKGKREPKGEEQ